jgi:hypothetical protein
MITPVLKSLHSPDVNLETFRPQKDPDRFGFLLQAFFGSTDAPRIFRSYGLYALLVLNED